jgi:hypothetical protein
MHTGDVGDTRHHSTTLTVDEKHGSAGVSALTSQRRRRRRLRRGKKNG